MIRRKLALAIISIAGLTSAQKIWTTPIVNSVLLPAHAQTTCRDILDIDVLGRWRFLDRNQNSVDIDFIDENSLVFNNQPNRNEWRRSSFDGVLILNIRPPRASWQARISGEDGCVASEITIFIAPGDQAGFTAEPPLIGSRVGTRN